MSLYGSSVAHAKTEYGKGVGWYKMCLLSASTLCISAFHPLKDGHGSHAGLNQTSAAMQSFKAKKACCKKQFDNSLQGCIQPQGVPDRTRICVVLWRLSPELCLGPKALGISLVA
jgi:hypothetical protein